MVKQKHQVDLCGNTNKHIYNKMKHSELKELIREEIHKIISEIFKTQRNGYWVEDEDGFDGFIKHNEEDISYQIKLENTPGTWEYLRKKYNSMPSSDLRDKIRDTMIEMRPYELKGNPEAEDYDSETIRKGVELEKEYYRTKKIEGLDI